MKERLQKLMAMAGIGSRRANEELIEAGRVRVNGKVAKLGDQADLSEDVVEVDGVRLNNKSMQRRQYFAIFKPRNVLAVPSQIPGDERDTVRDMLPFKGHLFSIGRLDADSDGLVVLTNDGELAQKLSHPRFRHTKTYRVLVSGLPTAETVQRWETGVFLEEGRTAPCIVKITRGGTRETVLQITMTEGKKRQIRRVASILGHPVLRLTRIAIGKLELSNLKPGEWRELDEKDVRLLSTPSAEIKSLRARRASRPAAREEDGEALRYGSGKDDDVRSEYQRRAARGDAPRYDDDRPRSRYSPTGDRDERPRREGDRPPRRDDDRPRSRYSPTSDRDERPRREGDRPPRRDDDRPRSRYSPTSDRDERPRREGDRPPRYDDDRPPRRDDDRPRSRYSPTGDRDERPRREGDRPPRRDDDRPRSRYSPTSDRDERPRREGDRPPRRDDDRPRSRYSPTGDRDERPRREGDRPARREGDRPPRRDDNRPARRPTNRKPRPSSGGGKGGSRTGRRPSSKR
jgi:23S rRNA pseudouridine2605 synthase